MASNFFAMISRLKYIDRWALMRNTHEENLSEHCMETACIAHALAVIGNRRFGKYYNAERAALLISKPRQNMTESTIGALWSSRIWITCCSS